MPTENRSSNTEMVSVPREPLRQFIEYSASVCKSPAWVKDKAALLTALEQPAPHPHPAPIAWMVGTAFWWTKEEAERDAAEVGQSVVGLGPMTGAAPAEQHQGEPAALPERKAITAHGLTALDSEAEGWNACLDEIAKLGSLYARPVQGEPVATVRGVTNRKSSVFDIVIHDNQALHPGTKLFLHADPGEVERLRAALRFYADREHYHFESGNWDTVSGEPLNILWCGEEPDFIEDGSVARAALERKL